MIDLKPKYSPYNECIENQVYTIINGMGHTNEFAYIDSMFFEFNIKAYTDAKWSTIGELVEVTYTPYIMNLLRFWNIEVQLMMCEQKDLITELKKSIAFGLPLIVFINSYWCPWEIGVYRKYKEFNHAFIVKDITSDGYNCTDGHRGIKDCFISKEDLHDGYIGKIVRIRRRGNTSKQISWKEMILSAAMSEISRRDKPSWLNISYFKEAIANHLNMKMELKGFESNYITVKSAPLMEAMRRTKNERVKYKWCIDSIRTTYNLNQIDELNQIIKLAEHSANNWKNISALFIKYFYSSDIKHKEKIIWLIDEIIEIEQSINKLMIEASKNNL